MSLAKLDDLPEDILVLIFPLLDVSDFLALCSVNKFFHEAFLKNPEFWREVTTKTFRVPVQPLLRANGPRWYWLYKNLRTQTKVYEWGGSGPALKHSLNKSWPSKSLTSAKIGNIVDLQCGGWSSSCLTSDGELYLTGRIDGLQYDYADPTGYKRLSFDERYPATSADSYQKSTAIKQFSSGRRHILALSDEGMIWSWFHRDHNARLVELSCARTILNSQDPSTPGTITKVVAGWDINSAFITGTGIVYWKIHGPHSGQADPVLLMVTGEIVPGTAFQRSKSNRNRTEDDEDAGLGEVVNYIVLEAHIVFITDLNKVYAMEADSRRMVELSKFSAPGRILQDVQGAFRNFAIFTSTGEVMVGNNDLIHDAFNHVDDPANASSPQLPAGLQHNDVISISFGDYHYTALHANGKVSSYGREPRGCGALGLGSYQGGIPFRGLTLDGENRRFSDVYYLPYAEDKRHNVWFEPEKQKWLKHLTDEAAPRDGSSDWLTPLTENRQGLMEEYSTCVERAGDNWDNYPDIKAEDPDGLGAYFALSVASAGWQNVALVLVNQDLADKVKRKHLINATGSNSSKDRPKYKWELQTYPPLPTDDHGKIDFSMYDFDTWVYGLPPLEDDSKGRLAMNQ
ncbi:hypothetical protein McanMca71_006461 [Microsporum canis]|uniref:F-box domain-containing protein n=1 Tax=Arthroderma otae (strain ATCC MYA-4605 / CBS 113480) TaxID=554155 RepID=C5FR68_ARTOC|nr:conserved hypothetical protein [Microsporum canis CBS 113480]EEQ32371.1 conserved hypothetical protein [Microsporum canis CBS 113480]